MTELPASYTTSTVRSLKLFANIPNIHVHKTHCCTVMLFHIRNPRVYDYTHWNSCVSGCICVLRINMNEQQIGFMHQSECGDAYSLSSLHTFRCILDTFSHRTLLTTLHAQHSGLSGLQRRDRSRAKLVVDWEAFLFTCEPWVYAQLYWWQEELLRPVI